MAKTTKNKPTEKPPGRMNRAECLRILDRRTGKQNRAMQSLQTLRAAVAAINSTTPETDPTPPAFRRKPLRKNYRKAKRAEGALNWYAGPLAGDEGSLSDLLCDLMHLCDRTGQDFTTELERAQEHFLAEIVPGRTRD